MKGNVEDGREVCHAMLDVDKLGTRRKLLAHYAEMGLALRPCRHHFAGWGYLRYMKPYISPGAGCLFSE